MRLKMILDKALQESILSRFNPLNSPDQASDKSSSY
jgi:hypothetical protein